MKMTLKSAVCAAALAFATTGASAVDISQNGGFETGDFTGWEVFQNDGSSTITTFNPSTGTFAANLNIEGGAAGNTLIKNSNVGVGIVQPGTEITITFSARGTFANGGVAFAEFFSELEGGGTSSSEILGGGPLAVNADPEIWTTFSFTTTAGPDVSGGVTLQFVSACGAVAGCIADLYIDDVSIEAVPVPAAVWLFGSALAALGFGTRRRAR